MSPVSRARKKPPQPVTHSVTGLFKWSHLWIYVVADLAGAILAGLAFLFLEPHEKATGDTRAAEAQG